MAITDTNTDRATFTLEQAFDNVPFYARWKEFDPGPSIPFPTRMASLPVLTKKDLRAYVPRGFIHNSRIFKDGLGSGEVEMVSTSGTTQDRTSVVWNQAWWNHSEKEASCIHPVLERIYSIPHREAVLTTPACGNNLCHVGETPMQERIIDDILFLNQALDPTSWDVATVKGMVEELNEYQPSVLEADPAYLAILSRASLDAGFEMYQPECITLSYEFPSRMHYRQIMRAFPDVPIVSSYGSTETGHVFTQCGQGVFHQNISTCHVDFQPLRHGSGEATVGRLLVTTIGNPWSVLVRFDVGDLARIRHEDKCPCGRQDGLALESIEGRIRDITFDTRGMVVTLKQLDDALGPASGLISYNLEQTGTKNYLMRYAAEQGEEGNSNKMLGELLPDLYGHDAVFQIQRDSALGPEQSGKFRLAQTSWTGGPESLFDD